MLEAARIVVRLPNHLGDACMALPALRLLQRAGRRPVLAGKPWAGELFAGCGWEVLPLPAQRLPRLALLRQRGGGGDGLLLTNSFSTALEFRLAGLRSTGYATDGRRVLLRHALDVPAGPPPHMVVYYARLADAAIRGGAPADLPDLMPAIPAALDLPLADAPRERARHTLRAAGVDGAFCVLCPVAVGLHRGRVKAWAGFTALCETLARRGHRVVGCPGPGEHDAVARLLPGATILPTTDVATFAALLAASRLVVANDSGPGHLAAAVGVPLVSIFGVTQPDVTQPWGPNVTRVGDSDGWPDARVVERAVLYALESDRGQASPNATVSSA